MRFNVKSWVIRFGFAALLTCPELSLLAAESFTIRAWAGFAAGDCHQEDALFLFKGDRSCDPPRLQYALGVRFGVPEFKYMDAKGNWQGIMYQDGGDVYETGGPRTIPAAKVVKIDRWARWQHLAAVFDRDHVTLYVNGKPVMTTEGKLVPPPENDDPVTVGCGLDREGMEMWCLNGCVRRHAYETRAMTDAEIAALYQAERPQVTAEPAPKLDFPVPPIKGVLPTTAAYLAKAKPMPRGSNCVSKIVKVNGVPRVCVNGKVISGMAMIPSHRVDNSAVTFACSDFSASGVRIFSNLLQPQDSDKWWLGEGRYDWTWIDARLKALIDAAPNGWIFPRVRLDPAPWWRQLHPAEYYGKQIRADSTLWKPVRDRMLTDLITHIENSPLAPHVIGYHIGAMSGSEWIILDGNVSREVAAMPFAARKALFDCRSKAAADALIDAAGVVKRLVDHRKIVGSFFGYSFIDQRDAARVFACPDLDFFAAPHSYDHRRAGQSGRSNVFAPASARLHNKVFWMEADDRTLYSQLLEIYRSRTMRESVDVIKRAIGFSLAEGWEAWWFLIAGNDTFHDETIQRTIARGQTEAVRHGLNAPARTESDVAVFRRVQEFDYGPGCHNAYVYGYDAFCRIYPKCGVAYDSYMFEDILSPDLPDYKVYVFNDAKTISPAERTAIDRLVRRRGKTAIWMTAEKEATVRSPEGWSQVDFTKPPEPAKLRATLAAAGAHIWLDSDDFVLPGRGYLMVHAAKAGEKRIVLPEACNLVEIYGQAPERRNVTAFTDNLYKGETRIYRREPVR